MSSRSNTNKTRKKRAARSRLHSRRRHRHITRSTRRARTRTFKKGDFYSGDGFLTTVWGPAQWHMLHTISFNYPVMPTAAQKRQYRNYVLSLQHVLPCKHCRENLKKNLKKLPLTMGRMRNRDTFSRYVYELHELVNRMLDKKSNLTYCDVRERYEHFRARCTDERPPQRTLSLADMAVAAAVRRQRQTRRRRTHEPGEKGCTEPLYGKKARCIIKIVPQEEKGQTMQIDTKCIKTR